MQENKQGIALTLFAIGVFMGGLDNGIMSSALTTIISSFGVNANWGSWVVTIYTLGLAVSIPIMAKLSDDYGRKRMFIIGVSLFGVGSMLVALSHSFTMILISRVIQALGGGGIFPIANGYIVSSFPLDKQGKALGMVGGMNGIAAILGPNIGSLILGVTHNDWHWLFWINVPIALLLVIFSMRSIKENKSSANSGLDFIGIVTLSLAMLSLMYSLTNLKGANLGASMSHPQFYAFFVVGVVLLVALLFIENAIARRGKDPLIPMQLFRRTELRWTLLIGLTSGLTLASVIFLPAFNQIILGWPSSQAGYWYTPMALASGVGAMGGGAFMDKRGPIGTLIIGMIAAAIGALLFPLWVHHTWQMVIASAFIGFGVGVTLGAPINFLITENVPDSKSTALGILSLTRTAGMTLGPTVFAGFLSRAMAKFPTLLMKNLSSAGIPPSSIPQSELAKMNAVESFGNINSQVQQIPAPSVRNAILNAIHTVAQQGFNHLYYATLVIALASLVIIAITSYYRSKAMKLDAATNTTS